MFLFCYIAALKLLANGLGGNERSQRSDIRQSHCGV
jgi:hypothetical protein